MAEVADLARPTFKQLLLRPVHCLAFGFGSGLAPKAPGTFGTLAAIPFYFLLQPLPLYWYVFILFVTFAIGVYLCGATARDLKCHDHPGIVWDEMVGYWLTMLCAPKGWFWVVLGFVLFRIFDIVKPWPIGWLDRRVHGGFGIMIDDVIAALFSLVLMQVSFFVLAERYYLTLP